MKTKLKKLKYEVVSELIEYNKLLRACDIARVKKTMQLVEQRDERQNRVTTLESQNKALQSDLEVQKALVKTFELSVLSNSDYNGKLREENKSLQEEKENLGAANRLHLMKIERLESALSKFEVLKKKGIIINPI